MPKPGPLVVIPARYASQRFPGKPLAKLKGKPMIQHVWERAVSAKLPGKVLVATDDERIAACVSDFGAEVQLTASTHRNGTERVAEVASVLDFDIVVNLQGDLPFFNPEILDQLLKSGMDLIRGGSADLVTAQSEIESEAEFYSPHTVKVVSNEQGHALYFSRSPIPHIMKADFRLRDKQVSLYKHYGIYCYAKKFLLNIVETPEGRLERIEKLEQLRVLEQGGKIALITLSPEEGRSFIEVNTPADLLKVSEIITSRPS